MDLYKTIRILHEERNRLDKLIASLEQLQADKSIEHQHAFPRRGRKGMSADERREVSERMKRYWAARRTTTAPPQASAAAAGVGHSSSQSASDPAPASPEPTAAI